MRFFSSSGFDDSSSQIIEESSSQVIPTYAPFILDNNFLYKEYMFILFIKND